jgi:hypothetical protein
MASKLYPVTHSESSRDAAVPAQRIVFSLTERSEDMRPSRSCPALFLSLILLMPLVGCGQASPDKAPSLESRASVGVPPPSKQGPSSGNNPLTPVTPAANPVPLAPGNKIDIVPGNGTVPGGGSPNAAPVPSTKSADSLDALVVPAWIAKELDSPDVDTRLRALETWAQSAPPGAVDPLILAFEDKDERVRARAMELIEQDWARTADAEQSGGGAEDANEIQESGDTGVAGEEVMVGPSNK